ncbi:MAG: hypothetical protein C0615_02210 [Desulfuromonas sp.]|nr:MAG: hypothetical protein C0615_02210 [Desulfuromonas sp.]
MGREELARALRQKGEQEIESLRKKAESEVEDYRRQREQETARQVLTCDREAEHCAEQECRQLAWRTLKRTRKIRLRALKEIDLRLRQLARDELTRLDAKSRADSFVASLQQIPQGDWQQVTVHPDDRAAANKDFPNCRIMTDEAVIGGVVVESADAKVRVDSSLAGRLEKIWPELSGRIIVELEGLVDDQPDAATEN